MGYHTVAMMLRILAQKAKHQQEAKPDAVFPFDFFTTDSEGTSLPSHSKQHTANDALHRTALMGHAYVCVCGWYSEVPLPPQRVYNAETGQFTDPTAADLEHQHNMQRQICDLMQSLFPDRTRPSPLWARRSSAW